MTEIVPAKLQALRSNEPIVIVDVREPWEYAHCHIEGSQLIPLDTLPARYAELSPTALTVMVCHHGMRSHYAADFLRGCGFERVLNLSGGIHRWACEVEPAMPQY